MVSIPWKVFAQGDFGLTENPLWDHQRNGLWWLDIPNHQVFFQRFNEPSKSFLLDEEPGSLFLDPQGSVIVAGRSTVWRLSEHEHWQPCASAPFDAKRLRFNDACQNNQHMIAGSLVYAKDAPDAMVFLLSSTGEATPLLRQHMTVNGLGFSSDARVLYVADTFYRKISAYDFPNLQQERVLWHQPESIERPDGLWVSPDGLLCYCMFEGARIMVLSDQGDTLASLEVPVLCPTKLCTGGTDDAFMFLTSAGTVRPDDERQKHPLSGQVLVCSKSDFEAAL